MFLTWPLKKAAWWILREEWKEFDAKYRYCQEQRDRYSDILHQSKESEELFQANGYFWIQPPSGVTPPPIVKAIEMARAKVHASLMGKGMMDPFKRWELDMLRDRVIKLQKELEESGDPGPDVASNSEER